MSAPAVTAALLVIGDEILSGRTKDKNIGFIAEYCTNIGIDLKEVRVVPDDEPEIIEALNALRQRYAYVFTTGGIGPTHDDVTTDAIAMAFAVEVDVDPAAVAAMRKHFSVEELTPARLRMAHLPPASRASQSGICLRSGRTGFGAAARGRHAGDGQDLCPARLLRGHADERAEAPGGHRGRRLAALRRGHRTDHGGEGPPPGLVEPEPAHG